MKSPRGIAFKSSEVSEGSYSQVALEYYDELLHPTCADFRDACRIYLDKFFAVNKPSGRIADIGCGQSLVAEFQTDGLCLIDESMEMISQNVPGIEQRILNIESESFGDNEFDFIFAILGDPYNSKNSWLNITEALKFGGQCIFIVPSFDWAKKFRLGDKNEKPNFARFITSNGEAIFLHSSIVPPDVQRQIIEEVGLSLVAVDHVLVGDLAYVRSPKILKFLTTDQELLDIYIAKKAI